MLKAMAPPPDEPPAAPPDGCETQRAEARALCAESQVAHAAHERAKEVARETRRDVVAARHRHENALLAADPQHRRDEKDRARQAYASELSLATTEAERREATATWARAVDRANRSGRLAQRTLAETRQALADVEERGRERDRAEHAARMAAERAEAACLEARVRLAACEERASAKAVVAPHGAPHPPVEHATMHGTTFGEPLVIEELLRGDRSVLETVAAQVAERTDLSPAQAMLHLQELIDAIGSAASELGMLVFDERHRFWSHLSVGEARDVIAALARLGFQFEPAEGWHAGRAPTPMDLSMALAYAGLDSRAMRDLPSQAELRELPRSIGVDSQAYLAAVAPDIDLDHVVRALEHRADSLGALWDEWGQIRPILLKELRKLHDARAE